jgi:hypothetical protein
VKWTGGVEAKDCTFFYNGRNVGSGEAGLMNALQRLESLNDGATVTLDYPREARDFYEQRHQDFDGLPVPTNEDSPWRHLIVRKHFDVRYQSTQWSEAKKR